MFTLFTLTEAREISIKLQESEKNIPKVNSLRTWSNKGLITGVKEFDQRGRRGGRVGLYTKTLPAQIATVANLKNKFTLKEMSSLISGWIINNTVDLTDMYENPNKRKKQGEMYRTPKRAKELFSKTLSTNIISEANQMIKGMKEAETSSEVEEARESLMEVVYRFEKYAILSIYSDQFEKYMEKLKGHLE